MSRGARVGIALPGAVISCTFIYTLFSALLVLAWGKAVPGEDVIARNYWWDSPGDVGHSGGRSRARLEREVRLAREEPVSSEAPSVNISTTVTDFITEFVNTIAVSTNDTIQITEALPDDGQGAGAGAIIGAIFGVLLGGVILGGALYLLIRYKRAQAAEYNRSVQVHMSSTRNAGVYVDLAEPSDLPVQSRDYTSLKQQNNSAKKDRLMQSDLYEYDSDDEVAVYN